MAVNEAEGKWASKPDSNAVLCSRTDQFDKIGNVWLLSMGEEKPENSRHKRNKKWEVVWRTGKIIL